MISEVGKRLINVDEYLKMAETGILGPNDRVELIHGEIFNMSPVGSKHAAIVKKLAKILNETFKDKFIIGIQDPVILGTDNEPEPDISLLKYRKDFYATSHPKADDIVALIEVAGSSLKYDHDIKIPLYASFSIPLYWIIDIENRRIEVHENPSGDAYLEKDTFSSGQKIGLIDHSFKVKDFLPD